MPGFQKTGGALDLMGTPRDALTVFACQCFRPYNHLATIERKRIISE